MQRGIFLDHLEKQKKNAVLSKLGSVYAFLCTCVCMPQITRENRIAVAVWQDIPAAFSVLYTRNNVCICAGKGSFPPPPPHANSPAAHAPSLFPLSALSSSSFCGKLGTRPRHAKWDPPGPARAQQGGRPLNGRGGGIAWLGKPPFIAVPILDGKLPDRPPLHGS